jgi:hypothetical protein
MKDQLQRTSGCRHRALDKPLPNHQVDPHAKSTAQPAPGTPFVSIDVTTLRAAHT